MSWSGKDGVNTIGVYRPPGTPFNNTNEGQWLLRNSNTAGDPDIQFPYGGAGDIPVVGDWTGSGTPTIGVYRPPGTSFNSTDGGQWLLRNSNTAGDPDIQFPYGGAGDIPVVGDWTGSGKATIGVYRPPGTPFNNTNEGQWLLRNSNTAGDPDIQFPYGGAGDIPVVGAWTAAEGRRGVTIGVYRPPGTPFNNTNEGQWLLRNSNTAGDPDIQFPYGGAGDIPVVGNWLGEAKGELLPITIGIYRPPETSPNNTSGGEWLLRESNTAGDPDIQFPYGGAGDIPVVAEQIYYDIVIP
jgi:hypothetical protein